MKMTFSEQAKDYLNKRLSDFEAGKLCFEDERQLFQDLLDTGYVANLPQHQDFANRLLQVGLIKRQNKNNTLN